MKLTQIHGTVARQQAYADAQTKALQHLDALRAAILAHGADRAGDGPQWGHVGFLDEVTDRLREVQQWFEDV